jgi:hypothetical protein
MGLTGLKVAGIPRQKNHTRDGRAISQFNHTRNIQTDAAGLIGLISEYLQDVAVVGLSGNERGTVDGQGWEGGATGEDGTTTRELHRLLERALALPQRERVEGSDEGDRGESN